MAEEKYTYRQKVNLERLRFVQTWLEILQERGHTNGKIKLLKSPEDILRLHRAAAGDDEAMMKSSHHSCALVTRQKRMLKRLDEYQSCLAQGIKIGPSPDFVHPERLLRTRKSANEGLFESSLFNGDVEVLRLYDGDLTRTRELVRELSEQVKEKKTRKQYTFGTNTFTRRESMKFVTAVVTVLQMKLDASEVVDPMGLLKFSDDDLKEVYFQLEGSRHGYDDKDIQQLRDQASDLVGDYTVYSDLRKTFRVKFTPPKYLYYQSSRTAIHQAHCKQKRLLDNFLALIVRADNRDLEKLWTAMSAIEVKLGVDLDWTKSLAVPLQRPGHQQRHASLSKSSSSEIEGNLSMKFHAVASALSLLLPPEKSSLLLSSQFTREELVKALYHLLPIPDVMMATADVMVSRVLGR